MNNKITWHGPAEYQIVVKGHLPEEWSQWFDEMEIKTDGGNSILTGKAADQSALHGLLVRVRDLGLPLISVERIDK